jgi:hypothetical protein
MECSDEKDDFAFQLMREIESYGESLNYDVDTSTERGVKLYNKNIEITALCNKYISDLADIAPFRISICNKITKKLIKTFSYLTSCTKRSRI